MKNCILFAAACLMAVSCATKPCSVIFTEGTTDDSTGITVHKLQVVNPPAGTDWKVWFCQFKTKMEPLEGSQGNFRHISGSLYILVPEVDTKGDTLTIAYESRPLASQCRAPEGFYLQKEGQNTVPLEVSYNFLPCDAVHSFDYTKTETSVTDMIPQLKKVIPGSGGTTAVNIDATPQIVGGQVAGWYRITLDGNTRIEAADEDGAFWAKVTLENIVRNAGGNEIADMTVEDWPDLSHRGLMLDVCRNFTSKENVLKLIDILAHYKADVLHLHLGDDEGWRLEIDSLPELTQYGAFRGVPVLNPDGTISEDDALQNSYSGSLDRNDAAAPGNGFYTHADFVEILSYAAARHIRVIPEFDTPGHSRAAIKSMEKRFARTGDGSCLLSEAEDKSVYESVQNYPDNAINVALPSTYKFIETVFDAIMALYAEAGARLEAIHIGGDEVPSGAWADSPACRRLMEEKGWDDITALKGYYIDRVLDIAAEKGVRIAGWQEAAQHLDETTFEKLKTGVDYINVWSVSGGRTELAYKLANSGINVILSNAPNAYMDFAYNDSKLERGHNWGGYVDERRSFSMLPFDIYRSVRWDDGRNVVDIEKAGEGKEALTQQGKSNIKGVQGQLWTETIRNFDQVTYYIFPKIVGLLERGWNAEPEWASTTKADDPLFTSSFDKFYSIIVDREMPYYESLGICYHKN